MAFPLENILDKVPVPKSIVRILGIGAAAVGFGKWGLGGFQGFQSQDGLDRIRGGSGKLSAGRTQTEMLFGSTKNDGEKKKILILMSDTGGGHKASALSLEAAMKIAFPGKIEVDIVDIWTDYGAYPYNKFVPGYQFLAKNPVLWKAFWEYGRFPLSRIFSEQTSNLACHDSFRSCIEKYNPDLIISVHPLCQDLPLRCLKNIGGGKRQIPFVTVVTDLGGAHPTWFDKRVDQCFVPSNALYKIAKKCGLRDDQITQHGLPIREGFWKETASKPTLRKKLGLKNDDKTVLVVGGGDGVGGLLNVAETLIERLGQNNQKSQVVVVCGKNEAVKTTLSTKKHPENVNVVVNGFVTNMDEWMGAVDCIVTKAGPGTIAEAAIKGLPCMLSAYLPGQEEGNIPYVIDGGYGDFSTNPKKIANTISYWLQDPELLSTMSANAKADGKPNATMNIAKDIGNNFLFNNNMSNSKKKPVLASVK
eukprot:CAMPEP_0117751018 /NCGR_PEP_ID=MMETSP0947-20121206/10718_1 /TAXON_ID=44440 /ORGANISM="Chattonella subsalsa, Strain CCMP2191" /LENGTH=475 /DNA_ID=CAMNT_0005569305 /DNA_START=294 /DNA_END=1721 /DNA_ORIENTATION=+